MEITTRPVAFAKPRCANTKSIFEIKRTGKLEKKHCLFCLAEMFLGHSKCTCNREPNIYLREVLEHLFCFCSAQITLSGTLNFKAGECETAESDSFLL